MITVIALDVLVGADIKASAARKTAKALYDGLLSQWQLVVLSDSPHEITRWWLLREHMPRWALIQTYDGATNFFPYSDWKTNQVRGLLADGHEVAYYIDTDGVCCAQVQELGVPAMHLGIPAHHPGWQAPGSTSPRAWESIVDTVDEGGGHGLR